jgi:hypothetical protein
MLPKINESSNYELTIPSNKKKVHYRPYLVKEEKILMTAFESGNEQMIMGAVVDTIQSCLKEEISVKKLCTFDIEYMFTQIRSKSVGEKAKIGIACTHCEEKNEYELDISQIKVTVPRERKVIELTDTISVEMKYPDFESVSKCDFNNKPSEIGFEMVVRSIDSILTGEEKIDANDSDWDNLYEFVESMTSDQFKELSGYLENIPAIQHTAKFTCTKCEKENSINLRGMKDFLS